MTAYSEVPSGSPSKNWQSIVGWEIAVFKPGTADLQSGDATDEPSLLPDEPTLHPDAPPVLPKINPLWTTFCTIQCCDKIDKHNAEKCNAPIISVDIILKNSTQRKINGHSFKKINAMLKSADITDKFIPNIKSTAVIFQK